MPNQKNLAVSSVATPPNPPTSGTSLTVASGEGSRFPSVPFYATVHPANENPNPNNAEIILVSAVSGDVFTISRAQYGTSAKAIGAGWAIYNSFYADDVVWDRSGNDIFTKSTAFKVGVGASPLTKIDARGSNAKSTTAAFENILSVASTDASNPLVLRAGIKTDATAGNRYGAIEVDDAGTKRALALQPTWGSVGVRTTSPLGTLDVRSNNSKATTSALEYVLVVGSYDTSEPLTLRAGIKTDATAGNRYGAIEVDDAGTRRALVLQPNSGNVGVRVINPLTPFDIRSFNSKATTASLDYLLSTGSADATDPLVLRAGIKTDATAGNRYGAIEVDDAGTKRALVLQPTGGNVSIGTTSPAISDGAGLHIAGKILRIGTNKTPASASDTGNTGEICWDSNYIYVCVASNTWKRAALSSW